MTFSRWARKMVADTLQPAARLESCENWRTRFVIAALFCLGIILGGNADAQEQRRRVLILYPYNNLFPTSILTGDATIRRLNARAGASLELYTEFLDLGRFSGAAYEEQAALALANKYRDRRPEIVIALGPRALRFVVRNRELSHLDVPVVFCCTSRARLARLNSTSDLTGIISEFKIADTLALAKHLQPNAREIAIVAGASEFDKTSVGIARRQLANFEKDYKITELVGLRHEVLIENIKRLPRDTIVILLTMFTDGAGRPYITPELVPELSEASTAPIYTPYEAYLGRGVVGGNSNSLQKVGAEVADLALEVLGGTDPAAMPPRLTGGNANRVDWRQVKRWGFKENALPSGTDIRYRMPTLWEHYHWHIIGIIALILVLTAIIAILAIERRRRRGAEVDLRQRVLEVFHLNSSAVAGALSASVVHEIRQPLGAIMNYAEAASLHLKTEPPNIERVEQILASIRLDDKRAVDIVAHLRELLKKRDETELEQFNLNDVVHEAVQIVRPEARKRGIDINACQTTGRLEVRGDRIQLRQVILNLAMNALDAMQNCAPGGKVFVETAMASDSTAEVIVVRLRDRHQR